MNRLTLAAARLYRYWYFAAVLFFFLLYYPLLAFYRRKPERYYSRLARCRRQIALAGASLAGLSFRRFAGPDPKITSPHIICANHSSNLDISAIMSVVRGEYSFLGKAELLENPVTGVFFRTVDIPVNRSDKRSALKAFLHGRQLLRDGRSLVIFPEGGIGEEYPPGLRAFKPGAFKFAFDTGTPVLPLVIHDTWKRCWDDGAERGMCPGRSHISVLSPLDPAAFSSAQELSDEVFLRMKKVLR